MTANVVGRTLISRAAKVLTASPSTHVQLRTSLLVPAISAVKLPQFSCRRFTTSRPISSSAPGKYEFMVHIPDHPNALKTRLAARPIHLKNLSPHIESGKVTMGGAILGSFPKEGETPDMKGSFILVRADSEEDAREWLRNDEYTKQGAWDIDNAVFYPFRCAIRTAM